MPRRPMAAIAAVVGVLLAGRCDGEDSSRDGTGDADGGVDSAADAFEDCANASDDDGDGLVDCFDPDCLPTCGCTPTSCNLVGAECGGLPDGCGRILDCGRCDAPRTCGGGGADRTCGCTPRTCAELDATCGTVDDGCGNELECGDCAAPDSCGGSGVANTCGHLLCTGRLCWVNPIPIGSDLEAVAASSAGDVWAVGVGGVAMRWNGVSWSLEMVPDAPELRDVWTGGPSDVWAVGAAGRSFHWDGSAWTSVATPVSGDLAAVWGSAHDDLWAGGPDGLLHGDGTSWTAVWPDCRVADLWGTAADDVWAVCEDTASGLAHFDGTAWTAFDTGLAGTVMLAVGGTGPSDVWAVGGSGTSFRAYHGGAAGFLEVGGSEWPVSLTRPPLVVGQAGGAWVAVGDGELWRFDGTTWRREPVDFGPYPAASWPSRRGMAAAGPDELWVVGTAGLVGRRKGGVWSASRTAVPEGLSALASSGPDDVWALGQGWGMHWNGRTWTTRALDAISGNVRDLQALSPTFALASVDTPSGSGGLARWDGTRWTQTDLDPGPLPFIPDALWLSSTTEGWLGGRDGRMLHWDGRGTAAYPTGVADGIRRIWGGTADDVWAALVVFPDANPSPGQARLLHFDGVAWHLELVPVAGHTGDVRDVWGSSADDFWAVGQVYDADGTLGSPLVLHRTGGSWVAPELPLAAPPSGCPLQIVTGSAADDVWVLGCDDPLHWDGTAFTLVPLDLTAQAVADGGGGVWLLGRGMSGDVSTGFAYLNGGTAHLTYFWPSDGLVETPEGAWTSSPTELWAVDDHSAIRRGGRGWSRAALPDEPFSDFASVGGSGARDVWLPSDAAAAMHFDGTGWAIVDAPFSTLCSPELGNDCRAEVWASTPGDVWLASRSGVHRGGAASWTSVGDLSSRSIWASGPDDVYVIPNHSRGNGVWRWDGAAWSQVYEISSIPPVRFDRVRGRGRNDVWATGRQRATNFLVVVHFDGTAWQRWDLPTVDADAGDDDPEVDVYADESGDVWVTDGAAPVTYRFHARVWQRVAVGTRPLAALAGDGAGHVIAFGPQGQVMQWLCTPDHPTEVCDGEDNDCDGVIPANEIDGDGDGFRPCDGDCLDTNVDVFPGQTAFFTTNRGDGSFDYDCNGVEEVQDPTAGGGCVGSCAGYAFGWCGAVPPCGVEGSFYATPCLVLPIIGCFDPGCVPMAQGCH